MIQLNLNPPDSWRAASIPKKDGSVRYLLIPNDELKAVQRDILDELYHCKDLRPSRCAVGFIPYKGTIDGAMKHNKLSPLIIQLDMHNFFPSFPVEVVKAQLLDSNLGLSKVDYIMRYAVFHGKKRDQLPQGAPTSPYLTNIGMRDVDSSLEAIATKLGYSYSRYADDMCFSVKEVDPDRAKPAIDVRKQLIASVANIIDTELGIKLSWKKTLVSFKNSAKVPRRITGVTIRKDGEGYNAPRATRKRARILCHCLWKSLTSGIDRSQLWPQYHELMGLVSYCDYIRSRSKESAATADPVIPTEKFNYIMEAFKHGD